jgi:hypothetical protein
MLRTVRLLLLPVVLVALVGCPASKAPTPPPGDIPLADQAQSTKNELVWKRAIALRNSLAQALFLDASDICDELGRYSCIELVHQVPLGGNDPINQSLYEPLQSPGTTTALSFDRLVLSACSKAVDYDAGRPAPVVFRGHALTTAPLTDTADAKVGARFFAKEFYPRVLAREPLESELAAIETLIVDDNGAPVSGIDFAKMACFAVASTTENLFY